MVHLLTIFSSFHNPSSDKYKTTPITPAIHKNVLQGESINSSVLREYIGVLETQLNRAMQKKGNP